MTTTKKITKDTGSTKTMGADTARRLCDPAALARAVWPDVYFYREQREILHSVRDNDETVVVAGTELGKDFVAAATVVMFAVCPEVFFEPAYVRQVANDVKNPSKRGTKIITTSATKDHLDNLWGEIERFAKTSKVPLLEKDGGPLRMSHRDIRRVTNGVEEPATYVLGIVTTSANRGEGLQGHHAPYTLFVADEASGLDDIAFSMATGWAKKMLVFGNPWDCQNYFRRAVDQGDLLAKV